GEVSGLSWDTGVALNTNNAAGNALSPFLNVFGISLTTPSVRWGLRLGRDLGFLNAPLNDAVPYLFFNVGSYSLTLGGNSVPVVSGQPLTVVFDPSDPFLFVNLAQPVPGFPLGVAFGASLKGQIPFTPAQTVPGVTADFFGHAYGMGTVSVPVGGGTVTLEGETVLDLD